MTLSFGRTEPGPREDRQTELLVLLVNKPSGRFCRWPLNWQLQDPPALPGGGSAPGGSLPCPPLPLQTKHTARGTPAAGSALILLPKPHFLNPSPLLPASEPARCSSRCLLRGTLARARAKLTERCRRPGGTASTCYPRPPWASPGLATQQQSPTKKLSE